MNKQILILILGLMSLALVTASVTFAVIHVSNTVNVIEPFSETNFTHDYKIGNDAASSKTRCFNDILINHAGVSLNVSVTFTDVTEISDPYKIPYYTINMPFNQTINPGTNYIYSCVTCFEYCAITNQHIDGVTTVTRL